MTPEWKADEYDEVFQDWQHKRIHGFYINAVLERIPANKDLKIVDIGCGIGAILCELEKRGYTDLTGYDFSSVAIDRVKAKTTTVKLHVADVHTVDFTRFDLAILTEILEHIEDDRLILPPRFIASVPNGPTVAVNHVREYDEQSVRKRYNADIFETNEKYIIFGRL